MSGGAMTIGDGNSSFADSRPQALLKCTDLSKDSLNTDGAAEARSSSSSSSSNKAVESSDPHAVVEMLKKELKTPSAANYHTEQTARELCTHRRARASRSR